MVYRVTCNRPSKNSDDGDLGRLSFLETEKKPYQQFTQTFAYEHVHFYLSKEIGEPEHYAEMIHRITLAGPADVIYIHLNTPGGNLDTGVQIINAMKNSEAKIVTVLESTAHSLGTLLFLSGDEMIVNEHCVMMFHNFNVGLIGKGNELVVELEAAVKLFTAIAEDVYMPFLTKDEFNRIIRGEDIWMQTDEIKVRLERMVKSLNARQVAESKQQLERANAELLQMAAAHLKRTEKKLSKKSPPSSPNRSTDI